MGGASRSHDLREIGQINFDSISSIDLANGQVFSGSVLTFADPNPYAQGSQLSAVVDWGDGAVSSTAYGSYSANSGSYGVSILSDASDGFNVMASHEYSNTGSYTVTVQLMNSAGSEAFTPNPTIPATVIDPIPVPSAPALTANTSFDNTVLGTVAYDSNLSYTASVTIEGTQYSATVDGSGNIIASNTATLAAAYLNAGTDNNAVLSVTINGTTYSTTYTQTAFF